MPRKSTKPTLPSRSPKPRHIRHFGLIAVVSLALLAGGVVYAVQLHHQKVLDADRARFVQAEKDVDALSKDIFATIGKPLKFDSENSCARPSVELGDSPVSCNIIRDNFYPVTDETRANAILRNVSAILQKRWKLSVSSRNSSASKDEFYKVNEVKYSSSSDFQKVVKNYQSTTNNMKCASAFAYYKATDPPRGYYSKNVDQQFILAISISCGDDARAQYYPMHK